MTRIAPLFKKIIFGLFIVSLLYGNNIVNGDGGSYNEVIFKNMLDIQGAKYVSEGAYYFIELTNISPQNLTITFFIDAYGYNGFVWLEADQQSLLQSGGGGTGGGSRYSNHYIWEYDNITIPVNTSMRMHFIAPQVQESTGYTQINYCFTWKENKYYKCWLTTYVGDINVLKGGLNGDKFGRNFTKVLEENWELRGLLVENNVIPSTESTPKVEIEPSNETSAFMMFYLIASLFLFSSFVITSNWRKGENNISQ